MKTFLIYTYKDDSEILTVTLGHLRKIEPEARIVVVDDAHRPMTSRSVKQLKDMGIEVHYSTYNRNGNLIGHEHTIYHAKKMRELCKEDSDVVVKLDPDTLMLSTEWVRDLENDDEAVMAGAFKNHINYVMGLAYAVKGRILGQYVMDIEDFPCWPKCYEDFEVSFRIHRLTNADPMAIQRYNVNGSDGWVLCDYRGANVQNISQHAKVFNGGFFDKNDKSAKSGMADAIRKIALLSSATKKLEGKNVQQ